jgi:hypothetical protein
MKYELSEEDIELIENALNCLREARESEIRYANGDPYIVMADEDNIDAIDALTARIRRAGDV